MYFQKTVRQCKPNSSKKNNDSLKKFRFFSLESTNHNYGSLIEGLFLCERRFFSNGIILNTYVSFRISFSGSDLT